MVQQRAALQVIAAPPLSPRVVSFEAPNGASRASMHRVVSGSQKYKYISEELRPRDGVARGHVPHDLADGSMQV